MVNVCLKTLKFIKAHMHVNRTCEVEDLTTITSVFELSFYFGKYPFGVKIAGPVRYLAGGKKNCLKDWILGMAFFILYVCEFISKTSIFTIISSQAYC